MKENTFFIDLGGSYTSIYKKNGGLLLRERSVLAVSNKDDKIVVKAFGSEAEKLEKINDPNIFVFNPFQSGKIGSEEYAKILLSYFFKKAEIKFGIFSNPSCLLSTYCGITSSEKKQYEKLFYDLGVEDIFFIPSIYLIALHSGMKKHSKTNLIVDLGANTFDIGVVDYEGVRFGASLPFGGKNINASLIESLQRTHKIEIPPYLAEKIKVELSSLYQNDVSNMKIQIFEPNIDSYITTSVQAKDVTDVLIPYIDEIAKVIETTLNMLDTQDLSWIKQNGIFVSGGMARISGLQEYLKSKLYLPIVIDEDCDDATINGASIFLSSREIQKDYHFNF